MAEYLVFGYARVSTKEQNLDRQILKFLERGIPDRNIFCDKESGKDFDRAKYQLLRMQVRKGDLVYFDALDRLGRDFHGIISEWKYFTQEVKCDLVVLENEALFDSRIFRAQGDFGAVMEHMFLGLLGYVAEQERKKMKIRQKEGIAVAMNKGIKFGRPEVKPDERWISAYKQVKSGEMTAAAACRLIGMSAPTWYRRVKDYESESVGV